MAARVGSDNVHGDFPEWLRGWGLTMSMVIRLNSSLMIGRGTRGARGAHQEEALQARLAKVGGVSENGGPVETL